jgi:restriction system protein
MQPYKKLYTYWFALIIYDCEMEFTSRWIKSWKLKDQMDGAARSGKQNIIEGSEDMCVSLKSAIKLTGVAKGSLEELIGDIEDFLRQRKLAKWDKNDPRVLAFRIRNAQLTRALSELSVKNNEREIERLLATVKLPEDPEEAANFLLTLCHQATLLIHRQVESLKLKHQKEGGLSEELYRKRVEYRESQVSQDS